MAFFGSLLCLVIITNVFFKVNTIVCSTAPTFSNRSKNIKRKDAPTESSIFSFSNDIRSNRSLGRSVHSTTSYNKRTRQDGNHVQTRHFSTEPLSSTVIDARTTKKRRQRQEDQQRSLPRPPPPVTTSPSAFEQSKRNRSVGPQTSASRFRPSHFGFVRSSTERSPEDGNHYSNTSESPLYHASPSPLSLPPPPPPSSTREHRNPPMDNFNEMKESLFQVEFDIFFEREKSYSEPLRDLYELVMNGLSIKNIEERMSLDFYSQRFVLNLINIIQNKQIAPPASTRKQLWFNMARLLFKWIIHMKQSFVYNKKEFVKASRSINALSSLIRRKGWADESSFPDFELTDDNEFDFSMSPSLIRYEVSENPKHFRTFSSATRYFYGADQRETAITATDIDRLCSKLRETPELFGGDFNSDMLLKIMILRYDPIGTMRKCFSIKDQEKFKRVNSAATGIVTEKYLERFETRGPEELESLLIDRMSKTTVMHFLKNNMKFQIRKPYQLIYFLENFGKVGTLTPELLKSFVEFEFTYARGVTKYGWNQEVFNNYLEQGRNLISSSKKYLEYFKMGNDHTL